MKSLPGLLVLGGLLIASRAGGQDLDSGPDRGKQVPVLKVFDVTGPNKGKEIDYAGERKGRLTIYIFIQADKWDRPMARFLKRLDEAVQKEHEEAVVVAVWLTDNVDKTKEYLPLAQQSLQFQTTVLACFTGEKTGPNEWNVNADTHLTVVVANRAKVAATFAYRSLNETNVPDVGEALQKASKEK